MAKLSFLSHGLKAVAVAIVIIQVTDAVSKTELTTQNIVLPLSEAGGQESVQCLGMNSCLRKILTCPINCPRRSTVSVGQSACFVDCSDNCRATCKHRKSDCFGFGAVCYDPRFIGGDGVMFYFHGKANKDFCIVSDPHLHINAHFIGKRPHGRPRDYTWVQALGIMSLNTHNLSIAAKRVARWKDGIDQLDFFYNGAAFTVPEGQGSRWFSPSGEVRIERTSHSNGIHVEIDKSMSVLVDVVPITEQENKIHNYQITEDDCFAHMNMQFSFLNLSFGVDGVLGQTYKPGFKTPVKLGVPMPIMGGEEKYVASGLLIADCKVSKFGNENDAAGSSKIVQTMSTKCSRKSSKGVILCSR